MGATTLPLAVVFLPAPHLADNGAVQDHNLLRPMGLYLMVCYSSCPRAQKVFKLMVLCGALSHGRRVYRSFRNKNFDLHSNRGRGCAVFVWMLTGPLPVN